MTITKNGNCSEKASFEGLNHFPEKHIHIAQPPNQKTSEGPEKSINCPHLTIWPKHSETRTIRLNIRCRTKPTSPLTPWTIILSDDKESAHINSRKHILKNIEYDEKAAAKDLPPNPQIVVDGIHEIFFHMQYLMNAKNYLASVLSA